ncbi:MAG TPA: ABC transporter ATP-binding protein [Candidatus Nanopelagicaceae bacterium]
MSIPGDEVAGKVVLEIKDLHVTFPIGFEGQEVEILRGISLQLPEGGVLGLVGESGSGKSMLLLSVLGLLPGRGQISKGSILLDDEDLCTVSAPRLRLIRGGSIGTIFQDPMTSLNPVRRIGSLLVETLHRHRSIDRKKAKVVALEALREVGVPSPKERIRAYPHELSGGLRQRVMIAHALLNQPRVILADEPTTALDTTTQLQILSLLKTRVKNASILFITHDLGVASELCDEIAVLYAGRVVERGPTAQVLENPRHPYTVGLIAAMPHFTRNREPLKVILGEPMRLTGVVTGCAFVARCERALAKCQTEDPFLQSVDESVHVACWNQLETS